MIISWNISSRFIYMTQTQKEFFNPQSETSFYCLPCGRSLLRNDLISHIHSNPHLKFVPLETSLIRTEKVIQDKDYIQERQLRPFCLICLAPLSGPSDIKPHCAGGRHFKNRLNQIYVEAANFYINFWSSLEAT